MKKNLKLDQQILNRLGELFDEAEKHMGFVQVVWRGQPISRDQYEDWRRHLGEIMWLERLYGEGPQ